MKLLRITKDEIIFSDNYKIEFKFGCSAYDSLDEFVYLYEFNNLRIHKDVNGFYFGDYLWTFFIPCIDDEIVTLFKGEDKLQEIEIEKEYENIV